MAFHFSDHSLYADPFPWIIATIHVLSPTDIETETYRSYLSNLSTSSKYQMADLGFRLNSVWFQGVDTQNTILKHHWV